MRVLARMQDNITTEAPGFQSFTLQHAIVAGIAVGLMLASCSIGRRLRTGKREPRFRLVWGWSIVVSQVYALIWWLFIHKPFQPDKSLPLHLCDVAVWIAAIAMVTQTRWSRTLLYFWGVGLSTQGFISPTLQEGPATIEYYLFWIGHLQIVGSAVYDIVAGGYRPRFHDFVMASLLSLCYVAFVMPINLYFGYNYGYIGNRLPESNTILNALPPWPLRVLVMWTIVEVVFVVLWLVWPAVGAIAEGKPSDAPASQQK